MIVETSFTPFFMKQTINFRQQIKHFKAIFDARTYQNLTTLFGLISNLLQKSSHKNWSLFSGIYLTKMQK